MNLAVIGFGNAGGKIVDKLLEFERDTGRSLWRFALAVNSAEIDLERLEYVPRDHQILIGQTDQRVKGRGAGADPEVGASVAERDSHEIERALDGVPIHDIDGFLLVAGLGGGTGSGGAPVFGETLDELYEEPVYGLGVLPSADEGGRAAFNAARSLPSFTEATENLLLFDNDTWRKHGETVERGYDRTNWEIARRVVTLLAAGEIDGSRVSEAAMDSSDVKRTLSTGGVSTVAYASEELESSTKEEKGLLSRFTDGDQSNGEHADTTMKVHGLVRKAVQSRMTCPADLSSAERSLIVVSGPPEEVSQKGIRRARRWLEEETGSVEVLAGDDPREYADTLSVAVLLSNVTSVPRIDRLQDQGVEAKQNIEQQSATREDEISDLITDDGNELDPI
ncbi:tubulin/FtsZ family protein [Halosimplex salinum]|uniref:tubulin/FtsZ family protein n=1 Tax=Halosimplex salinum TaxID=1710538 RepID=UPI000F469BC8|nr:tubulin/FtsZ family protein [Halosimplex salinum]